RRHLCTQHRAVMTSLMIGHARPDAALRRAWQENVEVEHALERARPQVGAVEQHGYRAGFLAELGREGAHRRVDGSAERRAYARGERGTHGTTKRSLGPSESRSRSAGKA